MSTSSQRIATDVLLDYRKLNRVTEKAIRQTLAGENLKKFEALDDLIEDLEE